MSRQHQQHLDVLKGVAICLVVVGHAFHFGFGYYKSVLLYILRAIDMPIFLFLSGMLGGSQLCFDRDSVRRYWLKKSRQLLLPLTVLPFAYAWIYDISLEHLLLDRMHGGYWFTWVLFQMFVLLYAVRYTNRRINPEGKPFIEGGLALVSLILVLLIDEPWRTHAPVSWEAMSWGKMNYLYYYFLLGYFTGKHAGLDWVMRSDIVHTLSMIAFGLCIYWEYTQHWRPWDGLLLSLSGLLCAYGTAVRLGGLQTRVNRLLSYLGQESGTIYLTHYFFLFSAPMVGTFLKQMYQGGRVFMWEATTSIVYASVVIAWTLLAARIIRSSPYLDTLCYGKKLSQGR